MDRTTAKCEGTCQLVVSNFEFQVIVASDDQEPKTKTSKEAPERWKH